MAKFTAEGFTGNIMAVTVGGIILGAVALPIFLDIVADMDDGPLKSVMVAVPIFLAIGLLVACVKLFISKN